MEFLVLISSRSLALKLSVKSHQMTNFFVQNKGLSEKIIILVIKFIILIKKAVIWRLFNGDLRAREQEREEEGTTNSAPRCLLYCPLHLFQWFDNMLNFEYRIICIIVQHFFVWPIRNLSSQIKVSTKIFITNIQYSIFGILANHQKSCQGHKISSTKYFFDLSFTDLQMGY